MSRALEGMLLLLTLLASGGAQPVSADPPPRRAPAQPAAPPAGPPPVPQPPLPSNPLPLQLPVAPVKPNPPEATCEKAAHARETAAESPSMAASKKPEAPPPAASVELLAPPLHHHHPHLEAPTRLVPSEPDASYLRSSRARPCRGRRARPARPRAPDRAPPPDRGRGRLRSPARPCSGGPSLGLADEAPAVAGQIVDVARGPGRSRWPGRSAPGAGATANIASRSTWPRPRRDRRLDPRELSG